MCVCASIYAVGMPEGFEATAQILTVDRDVDRQPGQVIAHDVRTTVKY